MYMGEYNHTIDQKGRLIMPSKLRDALGESFVITKGMDGCLFVFDKVEWDAFANKLRALPVMDKNTRQFTRFFLAGADNVTVDKMGRFLIPNNLREFADINKDAVLVGVGNRIEIWSRERWEGTVSFDNIDEISEKMIELGLGI